MKPIILRTARWSLLAAAGLAGALLVATACGGDQRTPAEQAAARQTQIRHDIQRIVTDPARADQVLKLVDQWDQQVATQQHADAGFRTRLDALNADYEALPEAFTALNEERFASDLAFIRQAGELRAKLILATTPAEWKSLNKVRAELRQQATTPAPGNMP